MVPIRALLPRSTPRAVRVSSLPFRRIHTSSAGRAPARANIPDYYQLLAPHLSDAPLAAKWALDTAALKSAWRKAQAVTHPDRMLNASPEEQEQAATRSALVNRAYETLREPLPRATYLLERFTPVEVDEEERLTDPALLAEVFEQQELLEDAESRSELEEILHRAQPFITRAEGAIAQQLGDERPDWDKVKALIAHLKYFGNIRRETLQRLGRFND